MGDPLGEVHAPGCNGDAPHCGGVYVCIRCARACGYCFGASDDMPAVCDDCWHVIDAAPGKGESLDPAGGKDSE